MVYAVEFATAARRQFRKLPRAVRAIMKPEIDALTSDPRPHGVEKMSGEENAYRVRVGDYRIIYEIHDAVLIVVVVRVGHRREVYR
ncbi:MAG: type II toxin-antitoxin system RelE/ParE family toxin [Chloroflexota bacterium]|nr:type II toxin-antitoxin system RelE/ParE family toxin [Chloroflexota bacterium]MDQ6905441.1 type II toxin-antitoxin system RelE/ParE family toxin [Chloroflexota bacterium]